jgi:5-methylcytosine-specific restriction endonuclease McrA
MWKRLRASIIERDLGFDLGVFGVYIDGPMLVHHINPINENDIVFVTERLMDPENLITTSANTHNLIHYNVKPKETWIERTPGDTKLW